MKLAMYQSLILVTDETRRWKEEFGCHLYNLRMFVTFLCEFSIINYVKNRINLHLCLNKLFKQEN